MAKKKSDRTAVSPPKTITLVVCDSVSMDPNTSKPTLYGLFDIMWASKFPSRHRSFALFAKLVGSGEYPISIHLVDPRGEDKKLGETTIKLRPKERGVIQADLGGVEFRRAGTYEFVLRTGRRIVGRTSFEVKRKAPTRQKK